MTKDELVTIMADKAGITKSQAGTALDAFTDAVAGALSKGGSVTLTGFGAFSVSHRAARAGRNPQTGAALQIPAMDVPKFKAGKALKDAVR
ncbi:MAG: DNA-binding protein HU [Candidatus Spechtbacteria bacterium RIFCSPLOWO2_12_FULL_38_22]|uniref:DNA-binding protein HU n=1 Tax=Candidatus Spechtbacteria bacterium RIFCSPLOWO2_12_FULL_38_22 TaxID=1802165 RepID=A0A1G2HI65_9BACT|nr:MAG: DNA-binding protein HU [Candidatus Spechtbacteria bacterium RIFCSPHIGHO2_01_FULL_38_11]OGZ59877.1 MAG: DNA-binding protein HU [Candidatus Spechtbacteria bacterium RIFCSPLOWO2_01_FULL_38_20]OGZ60104.1 MAG: DNA-binding protein HU [Candidatus Spechtbacteria bacterium RIFCSPHIGHO2_12_FULL_38_30]OGZ62196.1 MAG: DNA-binding protein HU [Candidatus Spechtbacteria bacterium RIFCSPLOWO2_12_FULL_38_22]